MSNQAQFEWDVFLSHSTHDKDVVRQVARRLADDRIRVWFDEWVIQPGDHIPSAIEYGLQKSSVLVLFLSSAALESDWVTLERQTATFRDPINKHRRFISMRIDDAEIPEMLAGFRYLDWRGAAADASYPDLLKACTKRKDVGRKAPTYHTVFTPGSPPTRHDLLVGREKSVEELHDYLLSPGIHPIVVGARGIGKTSLVRVVMSKQNVHNLSRIEVNTVRNFNECCQQICSDLDIAHDTRDFTPAAFLRVLQTSATPAVISIDELDDLPEESDIPMHMAKFAKAASNQADSTTQSFIFSGISRDAHSLFRGHLSASRNHPVVYLDRIASSDFQGFLQLASELLDTPIPIRIAREIANDADGIPYYMHQVGFHMFACFSRDGATSSITSAHFEEAKRRAADSAFAHYLGKYKFTIYKINPTQKAVLRHLVRAKRRHNSYHELERAVRDDCGDSIDEVKAAFRWLADNQYIDYRRGDKTVALQESLLRPFLKIKLKFKDDADPDGQLRLFQ